VNDDIATTRWHILKLNASNSYSAGGAYSASPDPVAGFKGSTSKGRRGEGSGGVEGKRKREKRERGRGRERRGREKGEEGKGKGSRVRAWKFFHKY